MSKKIFLLSACSIALFIVSCTRYAHPHTTTPTWQEDFNGSSIDANRWTKIPRGNSDWNRHMSYYDSCYAMKNGNLVLRGIKNDNKAIDTSQYLTGGIYTKNKVSFGFGRLDIRAKLNGAKGAWPAFWMLADNMQWPHGGEIDIMERLNFDSIAYQTVHSDYTVKLNIKHNPEQGSTGKINPATYNIYSVEKYLDSLVFFINNKKTFTYPRIQTDKEGQFPFGNVKHYLLLDMQLGGSWVGKIDPKDLPVEMEIDWVRFYEFKN
jgi:beta-glucanase (GH16 family)